MRGSRIEENPFWPGIPCLDYACRKMAIELSLWCEDHPPPDAVSVIANPRRSPPVKAPPLGVIPQYIWVGQRIAELGSAIVRYAEEFNYPKIIDEWMIEIGEHLAYLRKRDSTGG